MTSDDNLLKNVKYFVSSFIRVNQVESGGREEYIKGIQLILDPS